MPLLAPVGPDPEPDRDGETKTGRAFADNLDNYDGLYEAKLDAINRTNALSLFSAAGTK
jgi:hypothetical protein